METPKTEENRRGKDRGFEVRTCWRHVLTFSDSEDEEECNLEAVGKNTKIDMT